MSETSAIPDWAERTEAALLDAALPLVSVEGWTWRLVWAAGAQVGLSRAEAELLLPSGPRDLAALYARRLQTAMLRSLARRDPTTLKVRERIAAGVEAWLDAWTDQEAASRRWAGYLALPGQVGLGLRLAWEAADALWIWAGDTATDENHYTKRLLVGEILVSSGAVLVAKGPGAARRHAEGRIQAVMAFETWKRGLPDVSALAANLVGQLARRRFGAAPGEA